MMKVGDTFTRLIGGTIPMPMRVTDVLMENVYGQLRPVVKAVSTELSDEFPDRWMFDTITGAEIDYDLAWGPKQTGSVIKEIVGQSLEERLLDAHDHEMLEKFSKEEFEMFFRQYGASEETIAKIVAIWKTGW